jgi:hypothetical protein
MGELKDGTAPALRVRAEALPAAVSAAPDTPNE